MASPRPRMPSHSLLLLMAFALVCIAGFQTFRERKSASRLIREMDTKIEKLEEELQTERSKIFELQRELKKSNLHHQRLNKQLVELGHIKSSAEDDRKRLESSQQDKENEIIYLKEKLRILDEREKEIKVLKEKLAQKASNLTMEQLEREVDNTKESSKEDPILQKDVLMSGTDIGAFNSTEKLEQNDQREEWRAVVENGVKKDGMEDEKNADRKEENISRNEIIDAGEGEKSEDDEVEDQLDVDMEVADKPDVEDA